MEKVRKLPQRKCVGCGAQKNKNELCRVVRAPDGSVSLDLVGRAAGRGAYLCPLAACLKKARKARRLENQLECVIPDEVYAAIEAKLAEQE